MEFDPLLTFAPLLVMGASAGLAWGLATRNRGRINFFTLALLAVFVLIAIAAAWTATPPE